MDSSYLLAVRDVGLAVSAAVATRPLAERLLGPSFEYVGRALEGLLERYGNKNVETIFRKAVELLGNKTEDPGGVDPRIIRSVIEDGCFASDSLAQLYFAALLASSRSESGAEDRGLSFLSTLRTLSNAEVALHYKYYSWLINTFSNSPFWFESDDDAFGLYILDSAVAADPVKAHDAVIGLAKSGLISADYELVVSMRTTESHSVSGVVIRPSLFGARLYLWIHGHVDMPANSLLHGGVQFPELAEIDLTGLIGPLDLHRKRMQLADELKKQISAADYDGYDSLYVWKLMDDAIHCLWPMELSIPRDLAPGDSSLGILRLLNWLPTLTDTLEADNLESMVQQA